MTTVGTTSTNSAPYGFAVAGGSAVGALSAGFHLSNKEKLRGGFVASMDTAGARFGPTPSERRAMIDASERLRSTLEAHPFNGGSARDAERSAREVLTDGRGQVTSFTFGVRNGREVRSASWIPHRVGTVGQATQAAPEGLHAYLPRGPWKVPFTEVPIDPKVTGIGRVGLDRPFVMTDGVANGSTYQHMGSASEFLERSPRAVSDPRHPVARVVLGSIALGGAAVAIGGSIASMVSEGKHRERKSTFSSGDAFAAGGATAAVGVPAAYLGTKHLVHARTGSLELYQKGGPRGVSILGAFSGVSDSVSASKEMQIAFGTGERIGRPLAQAASLAALGGAVGLAFVAGSLGGRDA